MFSVIDETNTSSILVNSPKIIKVPNKLINNKWIVRMPSGSEVIVVPNYTNEQLVFNQTTELGSYEVFANDESYTAFSTKISPYESPKIRVKKQDLLDAFTAEKSELINTDNDIKKVITSCRKRLGKPKKYEGQAVVNTQQSSACCDNSTNNKNGFKS